MNDLFNSMKSYAVFDQPNVKASLRFSETPEEAINFVVYKHLEVKDFNLVGGPIAVMGFDFTVADVNSNKPPKNVGPAITKFFYITQEEIDLITETYSKFKQAIASVASNGIGLDPEKMDKRIKRFEDMQSYAILFEYDGGIWKYFDSPERAIQFLVLQDLNDNNFKLSGSPIGIIGCDWPLSECHTRLHPDMKAATDRKPVVSNYFKITSEHINKIVTTYLAFDEAINSVLLNGSQSDD